MLMSVVVPTHDQVGRLRLVLAGLRAQTLPAAEFEVIVVDDGSTDDTRRLAEHLTPNQRFVPLRRQQGRSRARNVGIEAAAGQLVVFLDGDALPAPDLLERYRTEFEATGGRAVLCGHQRCLPDLEYYDDPAQGTLSPTVRSSVVRDHLRARWPQAALTEAMVENDFPAIEARAVPGGYPFAESAERQLQVRAMLRSCPDSAVRWLGFVPHNGAIPRHMLAQDQYDEEITFFEGWELAYRLQRGQGADFVASAATSYHLYHYHPFAQQAESREEANRRYRAVEYMARKVGDARVRLLYSWFGAFWPDPYLPEEVVIHDLDEFDQLYRTMPHALWHEFEIVYDNHPHFTSHHRAEAQNARDL